MLTKEEIIQAVLDRAGANTTYLEIGVASGNSFRRIRAGLKIGVDPGVKLPLLYRLGMLIDGYRSKSRKEIIFKMPSDLFFESNKRLLSDRPIDVALVDGLHTYEQSLRDILNCLAHMAKDGVIVVHDCNPKSAAAAYPAESADAAEKIRPAGWDGFWCGDVWKAILHLRSLRNDLQVFVFDCDFGVAVIHRSSPNAPLPYSETEINNMSYADLDAKRTQFLNLKDPSYFEQFLANLPERLSA